MNKSRQKHYGFVFSTDALLSIMVLVVLLSSMAFFSSRTYPDSLSQVNLQLKANDMLVVLDKMDYLSAMDGAAIESFVNTAFEPNIGWELTAEYYNYVTGNHTFVLDQTLVTGRSNYTKGNIATANRVFIVKNSTSVVHYSRVMLRTWMN